MSVPARHLRAGVLVAERQLVGVTCSTGRQVDENGDRTVLLDRSFGHVGQPASSGDAASVGGGQRSGCSASRSVVLGIGSISAEMQRTSTSAAGNVGRHEQTGLQMLVTARFKQHHIGTHWRTEGSMERLNRRGISGVVHRIDALTSRATTAGLVAVALVACALAAVAFGVPDSWLAKFSAGAAAITLVMVFVIQHTQSREQLATQLKLDELIRALPQADDHLVHVEEGSDDELRELEKRQVDHHVAVRDDDFPR